MLRHCSLRYGPAVCQDKNIDFLKKFFHFLEAACSNDTALKLCVANRREGRVESHSVSLEGRGRTDEVDREGWQSGTAPRYIEVGG